MSGGAFDYKEYELQRIADEIDQYILNNNSDELNDWGEKIGWGFSPATLSEFKTAVELLKKAQVYAHRIDYLVSGDDGEETFHKRLKNDLADLDMLDHKK